MSAVLVFVVGVVVGAWLGFGAGWAICRERVRQGFLELGELPPEGQDIARRAWLAEWERQDGGTR